MKYFIPLLSLFFLAGTLQAQTDLHNSGGLYLTNSSDTVFISGSLYNKTGANLVNAGGNLIVKKDITNYEVNMIAGTGKLWTNGNSMQYFYGDESFKTYDWIVDNTNNVTLENRVEVGDGSGGNLSFINGQIISGTADQDVIFNERSGYTGYSDNNHIVGYCSKEGSTDFTFPIGNGALKADLDITNLTGSSVFQTSYFVISYPPKIVTAPLVDVYDKEYWTLDRKVGTASANITLKWNDLRNALNHNNPATIRVAHFTGVSWISEGGVGSGNSPTGSVTSIMVDSYSPFAFRFESSILPIMFNSFVGTINSNCEVEIKWSANDEGSVKKYYLQKLINNKWETIYECQAKQLADISNYNFTDAGTHEGNNSYRIISENANSKLSYTTVKIVKADCNKNRIQVYPSTTSNFVTVSLPQYLNDCKLSVVNGTGQVILEKTNVPFGIQVIRLDKYSAGIYTIVIQSKYGSSVYRVIKN